jgi:ubiquitin-conjugating enzyme E2 Z
MNKVISRDTIKRLITDVSEIRKNPLTSHGIHYHHDEEDMLKGYAVIIGPSDTPYYRGYYLFELIFPIDYPFSPPKIDYKTNGGNIRFNPNLYTNGKVCLSILNTWHGDPWSSCQTITSILLTLSTILNKNPLLNEPGVHKDHVDIDKYNEIIRYYNISIAICDIVSKKILCPHFYPIIKEHFLQNYESILEDVNTYIKENDISISLIISYYNLNTIINYNILKNKLIECKLLADV